MLFLSDVADPTSLSQVMHSLYDEAIFLNRHHKAQLKEEFGTDSCSSPWGYFHVPMILLNKIVVFLACHCFFC